MMNTLFSLFIVASVLLHSSSASRDIIGYGTAKLRMPSNSNDFIGSGTWKRTVVSNDFVLPRSFLSLAAKATAPATTPATSPAEEPPTSDSSEDKEDTITISTEALAGIIVGVILGLGFLILVVYVAKTRKYIHMRREASLARRATLDAENTPVREEHRVSPSSVMERPLHSPR